MDSQDELVRSKRVLDEKHFESGKLQEDSARKGDDNNVVRDHVQNTEREIDMLKQQRAAMWQEM